MRRRRTANEDLFALVLRHWQSLSSERERASFFVEVVLRDERFTDLLPFMVEAALKELDQKEAPRSGGTRSRISRAKEERIREEFGAAAGDWRRKHPGPSGLGDAHREWQFAVARTAARTGADPKTIKRRFPDPIVRARARGRALAQALREWTPKK